MFGRVARLRLDDALSQLTTTADPEKVFEGWSEARIKAYKQIDSNPNSYYYRFNAPGEMQVSFLVYGVAKWTVDERGKIGIYGSLGGDGWSDWSMGYIFHGYSWTSGLSMQQLLPRHDKDWKDG